MSGHSLRHSHQEGIPHYSLGLTALCPPPTVLNDQYSAFVMQVCQRLPAWVTSQVYFYPCPSLHITVSTLHGYLRPPPTDSGRKICSLWRTVLSEFVPQMAPFSLVAQDIEVQDSAALIRFEDIDDGVLTARRKLQSIIADQSIRSSIALAGSNADYFRVPEICHMTFARFSDYTSQLHRGSVASHLRDTVGGAWQPLKVYISELALRESSSYYAISNQSIRTIPLRTH